VIDYSIAGIPWRKRWYVRYSQAVQTRTQGYEITGVAGVEKITIRDGGGYVETLINFTDSRKVEGFDLEGLRDLLVGVTEAERLATSLDHELELTEEL
jgi:hypothetical protein